MSYAANATSVRRNLAFLWPSQRAVLAPTKSEIAVQSIAQRMGVRLPGAAS